MKIFLFDLCVHKIDIMIDSNEMQSLEESCQKILGLPKIRFVGVLNKMGNRIAGGFKKGIVSYLPDKESRTMYVELALEYLMRTDVNVEDIIRAVNAAFTTFPDIKP